MLKWKRPRVREALLFQAEEISDSFYSRLLPKILSSIRKRLMKSR